MTEGSFFPFQCGHRKKTSKYLSRQSGGSKSSDNMITIKTYAGYTLKYYYGAGMERIKSVLRQNGNVMETRYYPGTYEKQVKGDTTRFIHYINAGNGLAAIIVKENGVARIYYVYSDHLGSILTLTDSAGNVVARQNFDAWGRQRNPDNWTYTNIPGAPTWLYRGFTGHEQLPQFALINMNGRIYDPVTGRMLSPDNYVPLPWNTQGYNGYTYGNNNPLVYVDPDGNFFFLAIPLIVGAIINVAENWQSVTSSFHNGGFWSGVGHLAGFAAAGAVNGAINYYMPGVGGAMAGAVENTVFSNLIKGEPASEIVNETIDESFISGISEGVVGPLTGGLTEGLGNKVSKLVNNDILGGALAKAAQAFPSSFITAMATNLEVDAFNGNGFHPGKDLLRSVGTAAMDAGVAGASSFAKAKSAEAKQKEIQRKLTVSPPQIEPEETPDIDVSSTQVEEPSQDEKLSGHDAGMKSGTPEEAPIQNQRVIRSNPKYKIIITGWRRSVTPGLEGKYGSVSYVPVFKVILVR